jgi:hypothetical protein
MEVSQVSGVVTAPSPPAPPRHDAYDGTPGSSRAHGYLTAGDRALLRAASGDGADDASAGPLAGQISGDRRTGALAQGQSVDLQYLKDTAIRFEDTPHPMPPLLFARALVYLVERGGRAPVDVSA